MADIDVGSDGGGHKKGPGVKKAKKLSTRVDMTPMVDLGFLLITFFIFTTTMSTPNTMALNVPKKTEDEDKRIDVKESNALTIMLGKSSEANPGLYYYLGQLEADGSNFKTSNFADIRQVIVDKRKEVMSRHLHENSCQEIQQKAKDKNKPNWQNACLDKDFVVVIKPNKEAKYGRTIDVLDEMAINDVKAFAVVDITPQENELIIKTQGGK
ncbi:MAG TPA: biopolymer transporter ExbD [Flavisolibacter sp.]|nr:biopolymer transporter ExbD [Flavisolibacter sp.]